MEVIVKAKTVEEAVAIGAEQMGLPVSKVKYTVLEEAKKGFLGMFGAEAQVRVYDEDEEKLTFDNLSSIVTGNDKEKENLPPVQEKVVEFLDTVIKDMGIDAKASVKRIDERLSENSKTYEKDIHIEIVGKGLGILIGRHGDVLDALQYLSNIVVGRYPKNTEKHEYIRIVLDIENYREKREETLKSLARRMSSKVLTTGRNFTFEPMSAYERRIIHSEIQNVKGVHTYSIGTESNRRVVIAYGDDVESIEE